MLAVCHRTVSSALKLDFVVGISHTKSLPELLFWNGFISDVQVKLSRNFARLALHNVVPSALSGTDRVVQIFIYARRKPHYSFWKDLSYYGNSSKEVSYIQPQKPSTADKPDDFVFQWKILEVNFVLSGTTTKYLLATSSAICSGTKPFCFRETVSLKEDHINAVILPYNQRK